jgi:hypothetical protein
MNKFFVITLFLLVSCSHSVHLVHVSDFTPHAKLTSGKIIKAEATQKVILGFVTDVNYVDVARTNLISQCSNGDIQGITTRYSTSHSFLSWDNKIFMQALCVK